VLLCRLEDTSLDDDSAESSAKLLAGVVARGAAEEGAARVEQEFQKYVKKRSAGTSHNYEFPIRQELLTGVLGTAYCAYGLGAFWAVLASMSTLLSLVSSCTPQELLTHTLAQRLQALLPPGLRKVLEDPEMCEVLPHLLVGDGIKVYHPVSTLDDDSALPIRREVRTDVSPLGEMC
jgi:hypothetical protein